jgi:hypothetical protein
MTLQPHHGYSSHNLLGTALIILLLREAAERQQQLITLGEAVVPVG